MNKMVNGVLSTVVRIRDIIAPHFYKSFNTKKVHQIYEGGRGSTKTSFDAIKIAFFMTNDNNCNVVAIRKHYNTLRNSVYAEMKLALTRLGYSEGTHFTCTVSPMRITIKKNGNTIYFGGLDDYEKLKGMIADQGKRRGMKPLVFKDEVHTPEELAEKAADAPPQQSNAIKIVWMSEITEIRSDEEILQTVATFSRGVKDYFFVLYEYNPPKNKFHWVNKWTEKMKLRKDVHHNHSDYRTVPPEWLGAIFIGQAEALRETDEQRYNHIYLGEVIGVDGLIYNYDLLELIEDLDPGEKVIEFDIFIDTGHQVSATTYLCWAITNRNRAVLVDTYYYSPKDKPVKKAPSEFSEDLWDFLQEMCGQWRVGQDTMIIDSAEGGLRNQFFKDYGLRLDPVAKKEKETMIDYMQDHMSVNELRVLNTPNNRIFLIEHKHYEYKEGTVEAGKAMPNKEDRPLTDISEEPYYNSHSDSYSYYFGDHTCDANQYGVTMNLRKYGLEF